MNGMLFAETAVLFELDSVRIVFLILHIVIVTLFALGASKSYSRSHNTTLLEFLTKNTTASGGA